MLTQTQAARIVRRFPWPDGMCTPSICLRYLGFAPTNLGTVQLFSAQLVSGRVMASTRHMTSEGALRAVIDTVLEEIAKLTLAPVTDAARAEVRRLTN